MVKVLRQVDRKVSVLAERYGYAENIDIFCVKSSVLNF
jgi:hypothetical protein